VTVSQPARREGLTAGTVIGPGQRNESRFRPLGRYALIMSRFTASRYTMVVACLTLAVLAAADTRSTSWEGTKVSPPRTARGDTRVPCLALRRSQRLCGERLV